MLMYNFVKGILNKHNNFHERVTGLQRAIAQLDAKKRETERAAQRLEKDKSLLKKSMHTVSNFEKTTKFKTT